MTDLVFKLLCQEVIVLQKIIQLIVLKILDNKRMLPSINMLISSPSSLYVCVYI